MLNEVIISKKLLMEIMDYLNFINSGEYITEEMELEATDLYRRIEEGAE